MSKRNGKMKYLAIGAAGLIAAGGLALDATYQIQEQEQAVLTTFGVPKAVNETGLHFKVPFVQQVQKVNTTIQGFPIGYSMGNNAVVENEGIMITSDYNFIDVDFFVEYRISEPVKYLYTSEQPEEILKNIAQSCIRTVIAVSYTHLAIQDGSIAGIGSFHGKEERDLAGRYVCPGFIDSHLHLESTLVLSLIHIFLIHIFQALFHYH